MQHKAALVLTVVLLGFLGFTSVSDTTKSQQLPSGLSGQQPVAVSVGLYLPIGTNRAPWEVEQQVPPSALQQGVFECSPYSCLVVVPTSGIDEECLVRPENVDPAMPVLNRELSFSPVR